MPDGQETNGLIPSVEPDTQSELGETRAAPSNDESPEVYGVLKCYFCTPKRGDIWGAFCFLFNGTTGESMENVFWVTRDLVGTAIDVNMGWRELNKLIPQMGIYEKPLGEKLIMSMLEIFSPTLRMELCKEENSARDLDMISSEMCKNFERLTHYFLEFKMALERLPRKDLVKAGVVAGDGSKTEETDTAAPLTEEKSFTGTLVTCLSVIDPVHGKPVSELQPGDMLEVKMQGGIGAGELIQKYLNSTNQDAIFPVESIEKKDDDKTYVFLTINEEVKGLITVTKDLRLRVLKLEKPQKTIIINIDNVIFGGTLFIAVVVIALVVKFLFF
jgi:hypothetical protein